MAETTEWTPESWLQHPAAQSPRWPDLNMLVTAQQELSRQPPLVFAGEAQRLREDLAEVSAGKAFLLQAGDCAESFTVGSADAIGDKLRVILQMAVVLTYASGVPVVKVGRIAGQFAKPRSSETETRDDVTLEAFRGHIVNDEPFTPQHRTPDPGRLLTAYHQSASTLNLLRAFTKGGFADLSRVHAWNQEFVATSAEGRRYEAVADDIDAAVRFMRACGIDLSREGSLHGVDFYTSHEALVLPYEQALTRFDPITGEWFDCSAHLVWVGDRTRQLDGAHVEFVRGVANPVGLKVGPTITVDELRALCERLNPDNVPGRLTLIARLGRDRADVLLPKFVTALRDDGVEALWACDPMHGNTFAATGGRKTRRFDDILEEVRVFFAVHRELGTWPGGLHIELTGENVTECLGGALGVSEGDLEGNYSSMCDPRLNASQSLDLAFRVAEFIQS